jgi:hypothetical protein
MKITVSTVLRLCSYMSLAISFMPVVDYYCPWYVTVLPIFLVLFLSIRMNERGSFTPIAVLCTVCLTVLIFWFIKRREAPVSYFINSFIAFLPAIVSIRLRKIVKDESFFRDYLNAALLFVAVTCVTTMIGHIQYPMASRELASGTAIYDTEKYLRVNIGGYEFIYALTLLIPIVLWQIGKARGLRRIWYLAVLVLMIMCVYSSQYTLALICVAIAFLVVFMQKNKTVTLIVTACLALFLLANGLELLANIFYWASENVGTAYVRDRLLQVAQLLSGRSINTQTTDARIRHYMNELKYFGQSPIFGSNFLTFHKNTVSGHSLILDMLAAGGIIATSIMAVLMRELYRVSVPAYGKKGCAAVRAVWVMAAVIAALNPVIFPTIAMVVFPCCMCVDRIEKRMYLTEKEKQNVEIGDTGIAQPD